MSGILSEDITCLGNLDRSNLGSRELALLKIWDQDPWLSQKNPIEQPFTTLPRDCIFQILMIENISKSKLVQLDEMDNKLNPTMQRVDRLQKSKILIHEVNIDNADDPINTEMHSNKDIFKITLQDKSGKIFDAINLNTLPWISICMLGSKLVIKTGTPFNRGVFVVKDSNCTFLGGINRIWNDAKESKLYNYLDSKLKRDYHQNSNGKKRKK